MDQQSDVSTQGGKHVWTPEEDKILVECLVELKNEQKFMQDCHFKPGHLQAIEGMMVERLPGCGLKANPHIQSRIKTMKNTWAVVHDMVFGTNTSGFGWDDEKKCVTADKEVWEAYVKVTIPHISLMFAMFIIN